MSLYELVGFSTEDRGEQSIRHRQYTTSETWAEAWGMIPRIQFTDNGHGIVFSARAVSSKKPFKYGLYSHVQEHWPTFCVALSLKGYQRSAILCLSVDEGMEMWRVGSRTGRELHALKRKGLVLASRCPDGAWVWHLTSQGERCRVILTERENDI